MLAAEADVAAGSSFNIGGGSMASLQYVIDQIEDLVGASIATNKVPRPPGDPDKTGADISQAEKYLNWTPSIDLPTGIAQQVAWHQKQLSY